MNDEKKIQIRLKLDGNQAPNDIELEVLDLDGKVIDPQPYIKRIDFSLEACEPITFRAEMYGSHLGADTTVTVGTIAAFNNAELKAELKRRGLRTPISSFSNGEIDKEYYRRLLSEPGPR